MRREIAATLRSVVRNRSSARCMRHSLRYLIGDRPNTSRNRWSSTDRETVAALASSATVHFRAGSACSAAMAGANTRSCSAAIHPCSAMGAVSRWIRSTSVSRSSGSLVDDGGAGSDSVVTASA